ncbi:GDSL-type esterase/lipase family protein [Paractinoplanes toevensis]|uniref:GDSL-type esterase/lipase family protein n=1 Tax=Paractinoplanes toevensis TaxID=571911 RepID=UPI001BB3E279|nr:GDSL-type esterase/lipase family protein [Actinoplanes toevensis]
MKATLFQRTPSSPGCVAVVGASIATGYRAEPGADWPHLVRQHLERTRTPLCLENRSIGATRLLHTSPGLPSYLDREAAVLDIPNVREIVLTDLINDIQALPHQYDPQVIIAGIRRFVAIAHHRGVRVLATTITAYGGYHYTDDQRFTADGERCRRTVNAALRQGQLVDGYIDFDQELADPEDTTRLRPQYDSGDHLHPSAEGQRAMAELGIAALTPGP